MIRYSTQANGDIIITSLECPTEILNFTRDKKNPRLFHPAFIPCKYRSSNCQTRPCGALAVSWFCSKKLQTVTVPICDECEVEPKL